MKNSMKRPKYASLSLGLGLACVLSPGLALGAAFIRNPSFESNFNETWPHYSSVDEWIGGSGVNDVELDPSGPFHNAGTPVPDRARVGFKQGGGEVTQDISGLNPGTTYWLQFYYDGRRGGGESQSLSVLFNDTVIGGNPNIRPSDATYYFMSAPFVPESDTGTIRFVHEVAGDRTLLLDAVTVVARSPDDVVLRNPSFEASGTLPSTGPLANLAGWTITGTAGVDDGSAGYEDSGAPPDQDLVAFIEGAGSLTQPLERLIVGNQYEIRLAAKARANGTPRLEVRVGDTTVINQNVAAAAYTQFTGTFVATATNPNLVIAQATEGAHVLLLDNIRLLGVVETPLPPMSFSPVNAEIGPGQTSQHTLLVPVEAVAKGPVAVRITSSAPNVARLVGAASDGSLTLNFSPASGGNPAVTSATFAIEGISRGGMVVNVVDDADIPFVATPAVNVVSSLVKNASFESNPASAFPGYGPILAWTGSGQTGLNRTENPENPAGPFGDNGIVPDRQQVAFIQGAGSLSQEITGLAPGQTYWLQFAYNARACCNERSQKLTVRFAGNVIHEHPNLIPAADLGEVEYYTAHVVLSPTSSSGLLEFVHEVASGDASMTLDAVSLVARAANEIALRNPSFEASGSPPGVGYLQPYRMFGWDGPAGAGRGVNVDGVGPFTDNGAVPDQDRAALMQGVGSFLAQTVPGLTPGQPYTLVAAVNARNCCGGAIPTLTISIDDSPIFEEQILAVGGRRPYRAVYLPFTPGADSSTIRFSTSIPEGGDVTLLLDDVHIVPGTRTAPEFTAHPQGLVLDAGQNLQLTAAATGNNLSYRWWQNGIPLSNGARITGATTTTLNITGATPTDAGTYFLVATDGLGRVGTDPATVEVIDPNADAPSLRAVAVAAGIQLRWPVAAEGYLLQRAPTVTGTWETVEQPVVVDGEDNTVTLPITGEGGYFRLVL